MPKAAKAFCSTNSMATPCSRLMRAMMAKISSTTLGARPKEGSSSKIKLGCPTKAREMANICCSPPDKYPALCWRRSAKRGKYSNKRSKSGLAAPTRPLRAKVAAIRFSSTVRSSNTWRPSRTWAIPLRAIKCGAMPFKDVLAAQISPLRTSPFSRGSKPDTALSVVVLPAPFEPNSATMAPLGTCKDKPRNTWMVWW